MMAKNAMGSSGRNGAKRGNWGEMSGEITIKGAGDKVGKDVPWTGCFVLNVGKELAAPVPAGIGPNMDQTVECYVQE